MRSIVLLFSVTLILIGYLLTLQGISILHAFPWVFAIQSICMALCFKGMGRQELSVIFAPSIVSLLYFSAYFVTGSYVVAHNIGFNDFFHSTLSTSYNLVTIGAYLLLSNAILFSVATRLFVDNRITGNTIDSEKHLRVGSRYQVINMTAWILFVIFAIIPVDLSLFGAAGNLTYPLRLACAIVIITVAQSKPWRYKVVVYTIIFIAFIIGGYHSKREIFFPIMFICLLELLNKRVGLSLSIGKIAMAVLGIAFFAIIILWSSVMRGYGGYSINSPTDALKKVPEYVNEPFFLDAAAANFEVAEAFGNAAICIEYVIENKIELQKGSTILKVFTIPIPRSMWGDKPISMINVYTLAADPLFVARGGSYPVLLFSEFFANFHWFGLLFVWPFYYVLDTIYRSVVNRYRKGELGFKYLSSSFLIASVVQLTRGSGLDLYFLYLVVALPLIFFFHFLAAFNKR